MALSDMQYSAPAQSPAAIPPQVGQMAPQQQQMAQQAMDINTVPGARGGMQPQEAPPMIPTETGSLADLQQQVAEFSIKADNDGNPIHPDMPTTELATPEQYKLEQFDTIAQNIAANVQIDEAALGEAMSSGDPRAMTAVLNQAFQSAAQNIMFSATTATGRMAHDQAKQASDVTVNRMQATRSERDSINTALEVVPHLSNEMGRQMLQTEVQKMRKQFPTAPAELLGKLAARQVEAATQRPDPQQQQDVDWGTQF